MRQLASGFGLAISATDVITGDTLLEGGGRFGEPEGALARSYQHTETRSGADSIIHWESRYRARAKFVH
jgi:hypothetical protein